MKKTKSSVYFCVISLMVIMTWSASALKCRTEDGPTEVELRKMIQTCMKRVGNNAQSFGNQSNDYSNGYDRSGDNYDSSSNSNSDEYYPHNQRRMKNKENNQNTRYKRRNREKNNYHYDEGNYQSTGNYNRQQNENDRSSSDDRDRACIIQCFFQEMKMTGNNGLPEKHRVLNVITRNLRNRELKNFYSDSIQECFHVLDLDYKRDKCEFSKNFLTCLAERGRANCNDWNEDTLLF